MLSSKWQIVTFKVTKCESLFCKISTFLEKTNTCIVLQAEQIFIVNIQYTYFLNFGCDFCRFLSMLFPKAPASCGKKIEIIFAASDLYLYELKNCASDF